MFTKKILKNVSFFLIYFNAKTTNKYLSDS